MKPLSISIPVFIALLVFGGRPDDAACQQASAPAPGPSQPAPVSIAVHADYGAHLMLVDGQGKRTGYDLRTGKDLQEIPGAVYADDSVSDVTDSSDNSAIAEVRVLKIPAQPLGVYLLKVMPTDREDYRIEFYCRGSGRRLKLSGDSVGIVTGEQHSFSVDSSHGCSGRFAAGAYATQSTEQDPVLTYALPNSNNVHLKKGSPFRIVVVYDRSIVPSSFTATLNGESVTNTFHPKAGGIETVSIPVAAAHNVLRLTAIGTRPGSGASDTFTVDLE